MHTKRVDVSVAAKNIIQQLKDKHGELMFHQSGGCCDGSSPMCFPKGELILDNSDIHLGNIAGCDYYISKDQYQYWQHTHLLVDIIPGRGASFSLEIPLGIRFIIKSRLFTSEELLKLPKITP